MRPPQPSLFWPQLNPCVWHVFGTHPAASPVNSVDAPSGPPSEPPLAFRAEASVKVLNWLPPLPQDTTALASMETTANEPNQRPRWPQCIDTISFASLLPNGRMRETFIM